MTQELAFWIEGIVEDDPLGDEIKNIVFNIIGNNYKHLEMLGYEGEPCENALVYRPLEAQFFNCNKLLKFSDEIFFNKIEYYIQEAFGSDILKQQFKNRKIYLKFKNNLKLLFVV